MCEYVHVWLQVPEEGVGAQRAEANPLTWALGSKLQSPARVAGTLTYWVYAALGLASPHLLLLSSVTAVFSLVSPSRHPWVLAQRWMKFSSLLVKEIEASALCVPAKCCTTELKCQLCHSFIFFNFSCLSFLDSPFTLFILLCPSRHLAFFLVQKFIAGS